MEKILTIISLTQRIYGRWLSQQLLSSIIAIVGLIIVIAIMVSAALIGGLITSYFSLRYYGVEPQTAIISVAILTVATIVVLIILALFFLQRLRQMPKTLLKQSPLTSRAMTTLDAFTDGFMSD